MNNTARIFSAIAVTGLVLLFTAKAADYTEHRRPFDGGWFKEDLGQFHQAAGRQDATLDFDTLTIGVGQTLQYSLPRAAKTIRMGAGGNVEIVGHNGNKIQSNEKFWLLAHTAGEEDIFFEDSDGKLIRRLDVIVEAYTRHATIVVNRPKLGESDYMCSPRGCTFVTGTTYELPAEVRKEVK